YRHVIDWLVRKPGAFEEYRYRDAMFPTSRFRMAYDALKGWRPGGAVKEYLTILHLAAKGGEGLVDEALRSLLDRGRPFDGDAVSDLAGEGRRLPAVTDVTIIDVDLTMYDRLLEPREEHGSQYHGPEGTTDRPPQGTPPADDARQFRGVGATGAAGIAQL
ncbi:hypothetical protein ACYOEI_21925, partial [Singulisphaera rosea]